jgi:hypothetical protein
MAGAPAGLPAGIRLSDHISLGVIARTFPLEEMRQVLAAGERERDLPAHVMAYDAIALALDMPAGVSPPVPAGSPGAVRPIGPPDKIRRPRRKIARTNDI